MYHGTADEVLAPFLTVYWYASVPHGQLNSVHRSRTINPSEQQKVQIPDCNQDSGE
jgi:hypothetical protein